MIIGCWWVFLFPNFSLWYADLMKSDLFYQHQICLCKGKIWFFQLLAAGCSVLLQSYIVDSMVLLIGFAKFT